MGLLGVLDIFSGGTEADDVNVLPPSLISIYLSPHRALGLDESSTDVGLVRATFRKLILGTSLNLIFDIDFMKEKYVGSCSALINNPLKQFQYNFYDFESLQCS